MILIPATIRLQLSGATDTPRPWQEHWLIFWKISAQGNVPVTLSFEG